MEIAKSTVLVTGAGGFIASHLCEALVRAGAKTKALVRYNSLGSWGWLDKSPYRGEIEFVLGDVRDANFCEKQLKGVDGVFNLAALIGIPYSYVAPQSYVDTNVAGALNICQAALKTDRARIVQMSTSEVYGSALYTPMDEAHPKQPQSPYSASKIGADALVLSFRNTFELETIVARPFNTFGPRQSARAVIPTIISQLERADDGRITLGSLDPRRDFNYVEDTCHGLMLLMECDAALGREVNVGSGRDVSIGEVAQLIADIMGKQVEIGEDEQRVRPKNSEVSRLLCDFSLAHELCGYKPEIGLEEGLRRTIEWFGAPENLALYKGDIYNV